MPSDRSNSTVLPPLDTSASNDTPHRHTRNTRHNNVTFKGLPKYYPVNIDALGIMQFPRIATLNRKQLNPTLNHVGFFHVSNASEEDIDPLKEQCTFKEAMKSPYKQKFSKAMVHEINKHATRKHWDYVRKSDVPESLILRSTWTFRIKRNR